MKRLVLFMATSVLPLGAAGLASATLHLTTCSPERTDLLQGLSGYYRFEGNGNDSSGNGHSLDLFGGVGYGPGRFGKALRFHGNGSLFAHAPVRDAVFDFGSRDFTVQIWVYFNNHNREQTLIEKFEGANGAGWTLSTPDNQYQFYSNATGPISSPDIISSRIWHHVVARRNGAVVELFVDGSVVATGFANGPIRSTPQPLLIGKRNADDRRDFSVDGRLDEAAIWNRALTNNEITALWNRGNGRSLNVDIGATLHRQR